ncbi:hypothetical protein G6F22_021576 [Rhizopus arrhizus]|nr:hypothetical protein G6F22_021576 [Rhizopus arrhizus]KAG0897635.1 hypothetical protein G6F32_017372 [Rhizopus arrhizus]KAG1243538.1 hypothetical protein G6F66_015685 [Rhizopus arrhizus]KAG1374515.1 hypothetical protein G6F60_015500 [Rhizopus arrhizus]KAG1473223.1 hypothetical protein G6F54_014385 [Rhizopus delemar]
MQPVLAIRRGVAVIGQLRFEGAWVGRVTCAVQFQRPRMPACIGVAGSPAYGRCSALCPSRRARLRRR